MTEARLSLGRWGEEEAARYLVARGMKLLERNLRTPVGEIDLILSQGKFLIFVEVKTRRGLAFGSPLEAVGPTKQRQILRAAQWYLGANGCRQWQPRFDVVAVRPDPAGTIIDHVPDAFGL